ncbi:MAG TPA: RDD family protein [Polyangiaceae bacterium]|jgi:uncharacterized RDD family membrane protein YckC
MSAMQAPGVSPPPSRLDVGAPAGNERLEDTDAEIETPELVHFSYRVAGPAHRLVAYAIDLALRALMMSVVGIIAVLGGLLGREAMAQATTGIVLLVVFLMDWGYYVLFESIWDGQSPGKRALGLRVVSADGYGISFADSVIRNLLRAADFLPVGYALGFVAMATDRSFRRLGDRVAGTMVVIEQSQKVVPPLRIDPPRTPEEMAEFSQRPRLDRVDIEALELFLRRRGTLGAARERELADMVVPIYRSRWGMQWADAERFLALLYSRATERDGHPEPEPSRRVGR